MVQYFVIVRSLVANNFQFQEERDVKVAPNICYQIILGFVPCSPLFARGTVEIELGLVGVKSWWQVCRAHTNFLPA